MLEIYLRWVHGFVFSLGSVGEEVMEKCNIAWLLKRARHAGATGELCFINKRGRVRARAEVAILTSCIWAEMEPYHNVTYSIYNSWQCIFFKGLLPTELCFAILCKCQQIPSKGLLARELLGLWGFDMVEEVASVIAHRDALVAEFEVKIWSFYLHK